jgi:hypothetical protein
MDNQITGLSGEFFVAAELLKRNFQVSLTLGNAKSIDLIAIHQENGRPPYQIQVKTLRKGPSCFTLYSSNINEEHIYIFVYLNAIGQAPDYFIMNGHELLSDLKHYYGSSLGRLDKRETINHGPLQRHKNNWILFEE